MGGTLESELETPKKDKKTTKSGPQNLGKLRSHVSGGELHLHDDESSLKVAVPVSVFWKYWSELRHGLREEWRFPCPEHGTRMIIKMEKTLVPPNNVERYEPTIIVEKVEFGSNFQQLDKYLGMKG